MERPSRANFKIQTGVPEKTSISGPLGSAVERVTSNDKVVSSTLAVGIVVPWPPLTKGRPVLFFALDPHPLYGPRRCPAE